MPEYQEILDTEVEPEAPLTSSLGVRFRDNPIAVWEGAPSAPRISGQQGPAVDTGGLFDNAVTADKLRSPEAGQSFLIMRLQESEFSTEAEVFFTTEANNRARDNRHLGVTALVPGVITCYVQHRAIGDGSSVVRVIKNGSQVQSWSTSSDSFQTRTVDVSVDVGDSVIFQQRATEGFTISYFRRLRIYSANPDMAVA